MGVAGGLFSVWCGLMKLYQGTGSFMEKFDFEDWFFLTGKLLKDRLVLAFMVLNRV